MTTAWRIEDELRVGALVVRRQLRVELSVLCRVYLALFFGDTRKKNLALDALLALREGTSQ
jgi:hypothetical protein